MKPIGIEAVRFGLSFMRKPFGVMVWRSVFALGVVLCVVAHGVKVAWVVGDGVAVGVRPDVVRAWLLTVWSCSDRGDGVAVVVRPDAVRVWLLMVWSCSDRGECVAVGVSCLLVA